MEFITTPYYDTMQSAIYALPDVTFDLNGNGDDDSCAETEELSYDEDGPDRSPTVLIDLRQQPTRRSTRRTEVQLLYDLTNRFNKWPTNRCHCK